MGRVVPDVFDTDLESAIALDPENLEAFGVYVDWLLERGSPRGALGAVQLARERGDTAALAAQEQALLREHATLVVGEPGADGYRLDAWCSDLTYRGGFWRTVRFSGRTEVLDRLLAHPSARLLCSLAIDYLDGLDEAYEAAVAAIARARLPVLRRLRLGDLPEGQSDLARFGDRRTGSLDALAAACPRLKVLRLLCPSFKLGALPALRTLDARLGATPDAVASIGRAHLPSLVQLELGFAPDAEDEDEEEDEDEMYPQIVWHEDTLDPLLGDNALPALQIVRLWPQTAEHVPLGDALLARVRASPLGERLQTLELARLDELEADDTDGSYTL